MNNLDFYRLKLSPILAEHSHASRQVKDETIALESAKAKEVNAQTAQKLLQEIAEAVQEKAHQSIAAVVSRCLATVFGENAYEFKIKFSQKRGKTEAQLLFVRDGLEVDPTEAAGGGAVDVAAFALRLACLVLAIPKRRRLLVLDEPFRFLSIEYRPAIRELLMELAKDLKMQFIMVTHDPAFQIGNIIELE